MAGGRMYYSLIVKEDGKWSIQFGDYSRKVVEDEMRDEYEGQICRIIKTGDRQVEIEGAVDNLNRSAR